MVEFDPSSPKIVSNKFWLSHDFPRHNRLGRICSMWCKIKGVSFWRNCGAASVRKYENIIWFLSTELIDACKLASVKRFWADVSSVSPLQSKLQKVVIVLSRKGYIVVTTTKDRPPPLTMAFITIFLRALSSMHWARVFNFISGRYNCWCRSTQSYEANQIHIQFTSTRVYNVFLPWRRAVAGPCFSLCSWK